MSSVITVYSDYLCPWCWPAAVRLRRLREEFPHVTVEHRAFLLVPLEGSRPVFTEYHLAHRRAAAERTGLPYSLPVLGAPYPLSSWPSQRAAAWVRKHHPERFEAFDEALFQAFFGHNRDIADLEVLREISGLPQLELASRDDIEAEHEHALSQGISSVPSVLIGGRLIPGAVEYEVYQKILSEGQ